MTMQDNRPNIVVDENFLMLEKRLKRRYAERASAYSNAEAIEQERNGARAYAVAPEAYGDSKTLGGISMYKSGKSGGTSYMTTDDFIAYFDRCRDTFGAMNAETVVPAAKKSEDAPRVCVNRKKVEQIAKLNAKANAKKKRVTPVIKTSEKPAENVKIEANKLEAFFEKLSAVKGRAVASVAAFALCCSVAVGGVMAFAPDDTADSGVAMANMRSSQPIEQVDEEAHADLLSTLE